jgi:hypothetical protein
MSVREVTASVLGGALSACGKRKRKHSFEARGFGEVGHSNEKRTAQIPTLQPLSETPAALVFG